jgi:hypothetical protein
LAAAVAAQIHITVGCQAAVAAAEQLQGPDFRATLVALILVVHLAVVEAQVVQGATQQHPADMLDQVESGYKVL